MGMIHVFHKIPLFCNFLLRPIPICLNIPEIARDLRAIPLICDSVATAIPCFPIAAPPKAECPLWREVMSQEGRKPATLGLLQTLVHHESIHQAQLRMCKRLWNGPDCLKPHSVPEPHRPCVAGQNKVELHSRIPERLCLPLAVCAHLPSQPSTPRAGCHDISAIADMRPTARLVGLYIVGPLDPVAGFDHIGRPRLPHPIVLRRRFADLRIHGVGFPSPKDIAQKRPDTVKVAWPGLSDHAMPPSMKRRANWR